MKYLWKGMGMLNVRRISEMIKLWDSLRCVYFVLLMIIFTFSIRIRNWAYDLNVWWRGQVEQTHFRVVIVVWNLIARRGGLEMMGYERKAHAWTTFDLKCIWRSFFPRSINPISQFPSTASSYRKYQLKDPSLLQISEEYVLTEDKTISTTSLLVE